jgi:REP element-mobilizing transposase RayT
MSAPAPIYTSENCRAAYQLNWSLTLFWRQPVVDSDWLSDLTRAMEPDGVRVLEHRFAKPGVSQLLVSTRPETAPARLVRLVKGRLQHLVRREYPKAFRRNYGLRSLGSARREVVEEYVRSQVEHYPMADPRLQEAFRAVQVDNSGVDLSMPRKNAHARYWYNLHMCFVNDGRCREVRQTMLVRMREMMLRAAEKKRHLLSHAGIVSDHVHLTLGCNVAESPAEVALSYMNNLAYVCDLKRLFAFGFYVGTPGEYDLGVTWL